MAADSVGQIGLDLVVNRNQFESQMAGIQGLAKKAGLALAAAFSIKKLIDFGKSCVDLGSQLAEVDNVIQQAIPSMQKQVDAFAKNAIQQFGMSETLAKRYTGVYASMARGFNFSEKSAASMGVTLTGLAADVASFYDTSQDEAFTKLKGIFTGETEALKGLGVVMTQAALDQYALANGYGKTVKSMTEAEKVALRYAYVQEQLRFANGDFARTSDSWANQVRILNEQFNALKATIGQGLINVLTPVIQVINTIISKLMSLANAFKAFTELISGKKGSGGGATATAAAGMDAVAAAADNASDAVSGTGGAAKKAAKDIKGVNTGIDELNIINPNTDSGGGGTGGGGGGYNPDEFDMGELDTSPVDELESKYASLINRLKELGGLFKEGFKIGFGDTSVLESIQGHLDGIKDSLKNIFTDKDVLNAGKRFADALALNLGKVAGSVASIGATIADNLLGGIDKYLKKDSQRIKDFLVSMFDIGAEVATIIGNFSVAVADIFTVFRSDTAKQITADLIKIFMDGFMGVKQLAGMFGRDVLDLITAPIINNTGGFKDALNGLLEAVQTVTSSIADTFEYFVDGILKLYDESVKPLIQSFRDGFTEIVTVILEAFNTYILPVIQYAAERFQAFCSETMQPLIDKFLEFAAKVCECIQALWENVLQPFLAWFISNVAPRISNELKIAAAVFSSFLSAVGVVLGLIIDVLCDFIDFLTGVFTGDWEKAWEGIKTFLFGNCEGMKTIVSAFSNAIHVIINCFLLGIKTIWETTWNNIKNFISELWDGIKKKAEEIFEAIRDKLSEIWDAVKKTIEEKWNAIKAWFEGIWQAIKNVFKLEEMTQIGQTMMNNFWDGMKAIWAKIENWLRGICEAVGSAFNTVIDKVTSLAKSAKDDVEKEDEGVTSSGPTLTSGSSSSSGGPGVQGHATGGFPDSGNMFIANEDGNTEMVGSWGGKAAVANNMQITEGITRAVQYGMKSAIAPLVTNIQTITANATPNLTTVGSVGSSVSDETRLMEMIGKATAMNQNGNNSDRYLGIMVDLLKKIIELIENLDLVVSFDIRDMKKKLVALENRQGFSF